MSSFFEKLKKGMGVEEPIADEEEVEKEKAEEETEEQPEEEPTEELEEEPEEKPEEEPTEEPKEETKEKKESEPKKEEKKKTNKAKTNKALKSRIIKIKDRKEVIEEKKKEDEEKEEDKKENAKEKDLPEEKNWSSLNKAEEGQLAIDVYQTENELIIQSAVAGVKAENLDISMEQDIIVIKGNRQKPFEEQGDYFIQECFWGPFSREIILPAEVDPTRASAEMKNNILTIKIPKIIREKKRKIIVRE